jgi:hypothetical protein
MGYICDETHNFNLKQSTTIKHKSVDNYERNEIKIDEQYVAGQPPTHKDVTHDILTPIERSLKNELDFDYYKYRKNKDGPIPSALSYSNCSHYKLPKLSDTLDTIVDYTNKFLVKLKPLSQQNVIKKNSFSSSASSLFIPSTLSLSIPISSTTLSSKSLSLKRNTVTLESGASIATKNESHRHNTIESPQAPSDVTSTTVYSTTGNINLTTASTSSHHNNSFGLVKHSLCFYAASSVIIALCYLTTPIAAYDSVHPIK